MTLTGNGWLKPMSPVTLLGEARGNITDAWESPGWGGGLRGKGWP